MKSWKKFPRLILFLALLAGLSTPSFVDGFVSAAPRMQAATNIVISEFRTTGPGGATDEFVELYNPTSNPIDIGGWQIWGSNGNVPPGTSNRKTINIGVIMPPGGHYLISHSGGSYALIADATYGTGITDDGGIALILSDGVTIIDQVGMSNNSAYKEVSALSPLSGISDQSYERNLDISGSCIDAGNNSTDFFLRNPSDPQSSLSVVTTCGNPTSTPTPTNTSSPTLTPSATSTPTNTLIFSLTPSLTPIPSEVVISEVAWSGTKASPNDEWIELYNPRSTLIDITGWRLVNSTGSVDIVLNGTIPANGFFLLERVVGTVTNFPENQIYTGLLLPDAGDILYLRKPTGILVDTANSDGGSWPAGSGSPNFYSMERVVNGTVAAKDNSTGWITNNQSAAWSGLDAANNPIHGTPGTGNWSFSVTPTLTAKASLTRSVLINEIAWAGTSSALTNDEWIELYNPGSVSINITGWTLKALDGEPNITLIGTIPARSYFLLERGDTVIDDTTVSDITADLIYTGNTLSNGGEALTLYDGSNKVIDTANGNGGAWPKGSTYASMERVGTSTEGDSSWKTNTGAQKNGKNANGGAILGTPRKANSQSTTSALTAAVPTKIFTKTPTIIPPSGRPIISEFLPRPGFDWNQDGKVDVFDEFIEIKNVGNADMNLQGWKLEGIDASSFTLPDVILKPGERQVFYGLQTNILLSDGGETVRLLNPGDSIYDAYTYAIAKVEDQSICRLPDENGFGTWFEDCTPTPNLINTRDGVVPSMPQNGFESPVCDLPDTLPADFLLAECHGYGANIWNSYYWDKDGWQGDQYVPENMSKWESFVE